MSEFDARMGRVHALVEDVERRGGEVAEASRALLRAVLDLHEAGLARALEIARAQGVAGEAFVGELRADPLVSSLLLLHGLHPDGIAARVEAALARVAPELAKRGARAALVSVDAGVVSVSVVGGQGHARVALVEDALLAAAPDAESIQVVEAPEAPVLLPVERLLSHAAERGAT